MPAWAPTADTIAYVRADNDHPSVVFVSSEGGSLRPPLQIDPIGLPVAIAWSPDGRRVALVNLPGRAAAEVWVLSTGDGSVRLLAPFPAPAELDGVAWTHDGRSVIVGRCDYETEVLLMTGLR